MRRVLGFIIALGGLLGAIGSAIAVVVWEVTIVVMSTLKITGVVQMPWFAEPLTLGAISTGLWLLLFGVILYILSIIITSIGTSIIDV